MADPRPSPLWTDRDFADLRDNVSRQNDTIGYLKADIGEVRAHMERQSLLLFRILLAILGIGGTVWAVLIAFVLAHGVG